MTKDNVKDKSSPLVSVIIPCYNQGLYAGEAIESALGQTYKKIEIVCVDDCSTDNSAEVIREYADRHENVKFIRQSVNGGVCAARNCAIDACLGEYILPLDADDIIDKEYVGKAVEVLNSKPEVGIVYCGAKYFGRKKRRWKLPVFDKNKILFENCIFNCAMFRKKDFLTCGKYNTNMHGGCEDWDLWLSFVEHGFEVYKLKEEMFFYRKYNTKTRTDYADNSLDSILKNLFLNHINLYINNEEFYDRVFSVQKNKKKYRRLFNIFLVISIVEFIVIMLLLIKG